MSVNASTASTAVIICMSLAAAWGAYLSVRSTQRGPVWAQQHLVRAIIGGGVATAGGVMAALLIEPVWMGLGVAYVGFVVVWLAWTVNRSLVRAVALGLGEPLSPTRRRAVLERSSQGLLAAAGLIAIIALFDLSVRGGPALADLVLVAALGVPGWVARRAALEQA